ncbi:MarR family winged helix-turn-helix transcriptional regulator [Kineococcus sp. NUM-3379]
MHSVGPPDTRDLLLVLLQTFSIEAQRFAQVFAGAHSLHPTDLSALAHISRASATGGSVTPGELARALSISTSATTALVDRLQRAGHVERLSDESDRRRVRLRMTPPAQALATSFFTPLADRVREVLSAHDEAELERFAGLLGRVVEATRTAADEAHGRAGEPGSR